MLFPDIKIIVGGTNATALPEQVLTECPAIDIIVRQGLPLLVLF